MNSSGYWDQSSLNFGQPNLLYVQVEQSLGHTMEGGDHELQTQGVISQDEIMESLSANEIQQNTRHVSGSTDFDADLQFTGNHRIEEESDEDKDEMNENGQPNLEQIQRLYYTKGLEELESLQLLDLSPLANWKLSSFKQGFGLKQLRDDSPDTYWQSDGSNDNSGGNTNNNNNNTQNSQLSQPHSVTIQFSKKVSLERISIFTNFLLDESYTPSKIKIMAGSSDGWDLTEVCTVNFNKPIGWSHMIFNAMRTDGVLKCFTVKLIVLANHQDGKDSHIRAIRCFGKKSSNVAGSTDVNDVSISNLSTMNGKSSLSAISLNNHSFVGNDSDEDLDKQTAQILGNVSETLGTSGFQSLNLRSVSSIR